MKEAFPFSTTWPPCQQLAYETEYRIAQVRLKSQRPSIDIYDVSD